MSRLRYADDACYSTALTGSNANAKNFIGVFGVRSALAAVEPMD
jgi:hypothetical protein